MHNYDFPPQLEALLRQQLDSGLYSSEDEVLLAALQSLDSQNQDWAAVSQALDTLDSGEQGLSLDEAIQEIRRRNNVA